MAAFASFGIFLVALLVLMATRTPVAVALAMVTVAGTAIFVSPAALSQLASAA
jgi:C4-dicarboxylate transporter DctM subunit